MQFTTFMLFSGILKSTIWDITTISKHLKRESTTILLVKEGEMAKKQSVPPWILIVVGTAVAGISLYTVWFTNNENKAAMQLFAFVGIVFLVYGLIRYIIQRVSSSKVNIVKEEEHFAQHLAGTDKIDEKEKRIQRQVQQIQQQKEFARQTPSIIKCPVCGTSNYSTSRFCHMCGYRFDGK